MVVIRLARGGAKKRPFYRIVATDARKPRDGRHIEPLGFFNPLASGQAERLRIRVDRVAYWKKCGAQLSQRVAALCKEYSKAQQADGTSTEAHTAV